MIHMLSSTLTYASAHQNTDTRLLSTKKPSFPAGCLKMYIVQRIPPENPAFTHSYSAAGYRML